MGFDLSKNDLNKSSEAGYKFELMLPDGVSQTGAFLTVRGTNSPTVKAYGRKKFQEMQAEEQRAKRRGKEVDPMTLDEAEELAIETAFVRLIGWEGIEENGKAVEFNEANAKRILKEHSWIREQIINESDNVSNFLI